jgi:hypothetical protein
MQDNLNTPEGRLAAIQRLGIDGYNRAMAAKLERDVVATVNGRKIRRVVSSWGALYAVEGTREAWASLERAKAAAEAMSHD